MHEVLVNRLGGLSLARKSVVRLTDRPNMTLDVYRGRKTTMQQQQQCFPTIFRIFFFCLSYVIKGFMESFPWLWLYCCMVCYPVFYDLLPYLMVCY